MTLHEAALAAARATNYQGGSAMALANLGLASANLGDDARAADLFDACLHLVREIKAPILEARALELQGRACLLGGRREEAVDVLGRSLAVYRSLRLEHAAATIEGLLREAEAVEAE